MGTWSSCTGVTMKLNGTTARYALFAGAFLAIGMVIALASCNFGFLDDADLSGSGEVLREEITAIAGGERHAFYDTADELQYYEDHYITAAKTMLLANYSASNELRWYHVFTYNVDGHIETMAEYDEADVRQWSRRYEYGNGVPVPAATVVKAASFDGNGTPSGCVIYEFDPSNRVSFLTSYGGVSCAIAGLSVAKATTNTAARFTPRTIAPLKMPVEILYEVPSIDTALSTLEKSGYTYWNYDTFGTSELSMDKDWYPVRVARDDDQLEKTVSMELAWNDSQQITRKKSYYGSTLALDVSITYNDDDYPLKVTTSGAALLLPLEYEFVYESRIPARLNVSSNGSLLQWFKYEYTGAVLPGSVSAIRGIDPFALLDDLVKSELKIFHYDGDDTLVETFEFLADDADFRVNVRAPDDSLNGYYLASYDAEGMIASLSAYDGSGLQWNNSYSYTDAVEDATLLAAAALAEAGLTEADFGRLAETYLTDDITEYAKGFVMDLLF